MEVKGKRLNASFISIVSLAGSAVVVSALVATGRAPQPELHAVFLLLAFSGTVVSQARSLPAQNVALAAAVIGFIAAIIEAISAASGIPFGARIFLERFGPKLFGLLPWALPIVWMTVVLNSRGVARLMLRPWRKSRNYGFRVIGIACLLVVAMDLSFEPFAHRANHFWIWQKGGGFFWYEAPWVKFLSVGLVTLLMFAFATPALINKHPTASRRPPDFHPLAIWLILNLYVTFANAMAGLTIAAVVGMVASVATAVIAIRNARW